MRIRHRSVHVKADGDRRHPCRPFIGESPQAKRYGTVPHFRSRFRVANLGSVERYFHEPFDPQVSSVGDGRNVARAAWPRGSDLLVRGRGGLTRSVNEKHRGPAQGPARE